MVRPPQLSVNTLLALVVWAAALAAPPGGAFAAGLLILAALLPAGLRLRARGRPGPAWPAWLAGAAAASLACGLGGGAGRALAALPVGLAAAAGASLPPRGAAVAGTGLLLLELAAGLRLGTSAGSLAAHLLSLAMAVAVPAFLVERLRRSREELKVRLAALTGAGASGPPAAVPARQEGVGGSAAAARHGRSADGPAQDLQGLLELTRRALRARTCVLYERVLDPPSWRVAAGASEAPDFDGLATAPLGHGLVAWAARHEMPFRISEPGPQLRSVPHYAGDSETGSFLAVPLQLSAPEGAKDDEGGAWAVLVADSPHARRFEDGGEEALALHAAEVAERLELRRVLARWRHDRGAAAELPAAVAELAGAAGVAATARRLLARALRLGGASAGAVLWFDARSPEGGPGPGVQRGRGPVLLAAEGLDLPPGHRLDPGEESWAAWAAAHPGEPVALAAFHADRGMPRIARADGLDSSWSFLAEGLSEAGALALAWPERHLPGPAVLEALRVLAAAGAAALLREEAAERLAAKKGLDGLTGLPTRSELLLRGPELCREAAAGRSRLGLLLFDLEGSGRLLQDAGPRAWDEAVEAAARALKAALPASAELHRWGGDEFAALLPGAGPEGLSVAARRACAAASAVQVAGRQLSLCAGTASFASEREDFAGLLARAGQALGVAREVGGGKVVGAQDPPA